MHFLIKLSFSTLSALCISILTASTAYSQPTVINGCIQNYMELSNDDPHTVWVNMVNCNLSDSDIPDLLNAMNQKEFNGQLFLTNNNITAKGALLLSQYPRPHSYNIENNPIGNDGLLAFLQDKNISWLAIGNNQVDDTTITMFISSLPTTEIHALHLSNFNLSIRAVQALANNHSLTNISINKSTLTDSEVVTLMQNPSITEISLSEDNLGQNALKAIAENNHLKSLYLAEDNVGDDTASALAKLTNLAMLDLDTNHITSNGFQALLNSTSINQLYIDNNNIQDAKISMNDNLKLFDLRLSNNKIGDSITSALADHASALNYIYLDNNLVGDTGFRRLITLPNLRELSLRHNKIDNHVTIDVIRSEQLYSLDLGENALGDTGFKSILAFNHAPYELIVDHNNISDIGATELASTNLSSLPNSIDLSYNNIGDDSMKAIAMSSLSSDLILSHNNITDKGALALANPGPQFFVGYLDVSYNKLTKIGIDALKNSSHLYFHINTNGNETNNR